MTEYAVSVDVVPAAPLVLASGAGEALADALAEALASLGGAVSYAEDGSRVGVTMTVEVEGPVAAGDQAIYRVLALVPGEVVSLEVLTTDEQDRQLAEPAFPAAVPGAHPRLHDLADAVTEWLAADDLVVTADAACDLTLPTTWQAWELELSDGTLARITVEVRP